MLVFHFIAFRTRNHSLTDWGRGDGSWSSVVQDFNADTGTYTIDPLFLLNEGSSWPYHIGILLKETEFGAYRARGQYEVTPTTGKLHFQWALQQYSASSLGGGKQVKKTCGALQQLIVRLIHSAPPVSGCDFTTYVPDMFIQNQHEHSKWSHLMAYTSKDDTRVGTKFFDYCPIVISEVTATEGRPLDVVGEMVRGGAKLVDVLQVKPGLALQYAKNIQTLSEVVSLRNRRDVLDGKQRCANKFCRINHVCEDMTRKWAKDYSLAVGVETSYNSFLELLKVPCGMEVVYLYGAAGSGKSTYCEQQAHQRFGESVFLKPGEMGSFWGTSSSGYDSEQCVVIHDMDHTSFQSLNDFKRCVDCLPHKVNTKGSEALLTASTFFIDSQRCPLTHFVAWHHGSTPLEADYDAYCRRFSCLYLYETVISDFSTTFAVSKVRFPKYREFIREFHGGLFARKSGIHANFTFPVDSVVPVGQSHRDHVLMGMDYSFQRVLSGMKKT